MKTHKCGGGHLAFGDDDGCNAVIQRKINVSTPVELEVRASVGDVEFTCSQPRICGCSSPCYRRTGECNFVVNQTLLVEIPISYHVCADAKGSYLDCDSDVCD